MVISDNSTPWQFWEFRPDEISEKLPYYCRPNKKKLESSLTNFGNKIIDVFRTNTVDGKIYDPSDDWDSDTAPSDHGSGDPLYPPHPSSPLHDLSTWRVCVPCVGARPDPDNPKKQLFVFIVEVRRVTESCHNSEKNSWTVARRYKEFYVLEQKLKEFHGEGNNSPLPTRKNLGTKNIEFMESKRQVLESYLQKLLCKPELQGSQLLHTFLTSDTEFSMSFLPDINLGKIIKTVPMKLLKEKGQHLDPFLQSFIISTEAAKPKHGRMERRSSDTSTVSMSSEASDKYWSSMYGNNANMTTHSNSQLPHNLPTTHIDGSFDSAVYILDRLFHIPPWCHRMLATCRLLLRTTIDSYVDWFVRRKVDLVTQEHRVVSLVHLLRDVLFFNTNPPRTEIQKEERLDQTMGEVKAFIPSLMYLVIGSSSITEGATHIVDMMQYPKLNKNLSYLLLDLVITELFPEILDTHPTRLTHAASF